MFGAEYGRRGDWDCERVEAFPVCPEGYENDNDEYVETPKPTPAVHNCVIEQNAPKPNKPLIMNTKRNKSTGKLPVVRPAGSSALGRKSVRYAPMVAAQRVVNPGPIFSALNDISRGY